MSLLGTQLSRHPSLAPVGLHTMYARHPSQTDPRTGTKFVPAVHRDPVRGHASIFMYPKTRYGYQDRMLPDGKTIEYHPSTNAEITGMLDALVGQDVTLYVQTDKTQGREGTVTVAKCSGNVYHLSLKPRPPKPLWADMD